MNKILIISILTIIFVGTSPVSAWSPFEHSSKDWDWKDWTFLGCSIGVGLLAIGGSIYGAYRLYQRNKIDNSVVETMADRFVKKRYDWTTGTLDIEDFSGDVFNGPVFNSGNSLKSFFGIHTINFEDGSKASLFHDLMLDLEEMDRTLGIIYDNSKEFLRISLINDNIPLFDIIEIGESNIRAVKANTMTIESKLHFHEPLKNIPGIESETFTLDLGGFTSPLTHAQLFGKNLVSHMAENSFYVSYYKSNGIYKLISNQNMPLKYMRTGIV